MSKNNPDIEIQLPQDFFTNLAGKHLLLDTNVFIDASNHPKEFFYFFKQCRKYKVTLVTCQPVVIEFTSGSESSKICQEKEKLISQIVSDYKLPLKPSIFEKTIPYLIERYKGFGKRVSLTDYILGALLMQYGENIFLLTKNPRDFPPSVFCCETHFVIKMNRALQIYGVYVYEK